MDAGEDVGEAPGAGRPAPLLEVLPQEQVQRRTVEQIVDPVLEVPMLQMVVPQMAEQQVDILTPLDFPVPEQVIEVPEFVCPPRAARTVLGAPQTVEQLVEAPTIVSLIEVIRQPVEQPVDIPVRAWSGTGGRLQDFLPGHFSSSSAEQSQTFQFLIMVSLEGFQGFHPGQSTAVSSEQIGDIPAPHGGRHWSRIASSRSCWGSVSRVFEHLSRRKKSATSGPHSGSELSADFTPWSLSAHQMPPSSCCPLEGGTCSARTQKSSGMAGDDGHGERHWVRLLLHGPRGKCGTGECVFFLVPSYTDDHGSLGEAGTGTRHASAYGCSWKNFLSFAPALFALGIWCIISVVLVSDSRCSGRLGVASEYENLILREMTVFVGAILGSTVDTCPASVLWWLLDVFHTFSTLRRTRILKCFSPFCSRTEKRAQSMLLVAVLLGAVRTWKTGSVS